MDKCANCDAPMRTTLPGGGTYVWTMCPDCGWPEGKPVPPGPLCSVCRRHHGPEVKHDRE